MRSGGESGGRGFRRGLCGRRSQTHGKGVAGAQFAVQIHFDPVGSGLFEFGAEKLFDAGMVCGTVPEMDFHLSSLKKGCFSVRHEDGGFLFEIALAADPSVGNAEPEEPERKLFDGNAIAEDTQKLEMSVDFLANVIAKNAELNIGNHREQEWCRGESVVKPLREPAR